MATDQRDEIYVRNDLSSEIKHHAMWAGAVTPIQIDNLLGCDGNSVELIKNMHTPALLTSINEILTNSIDHCKKADNPYPVTKIEIEVTTDDGCLTISVKNDGPGIPVVVHKQGTEHFKRTVYVPELIFSDPLCGSSNIERKGNKSIKAGINSLGAKICNIHSVYFKVETVDFTTKLYYMQEFHGIKNPSPAVISFISDLKQSDTYTKVTFKPDLAALYPSYGGQHYLEEIKNWFRLRAMVAAMYCNIPIKFNSEILNTTTTNLFASKIYLSAPVIILSTKVSSATVNTQYPWDLTVVIFKKSYKVPKQLSNNILVVNGVLSPKGQHILHINKQIQEAMSKLLLERYGAAYERETEYKTTLDNYLKRFIVIATMSIPGVDWDGQTKEKITSNGPEIKTFIIDPKFLKSVVDELWLEYTKVEDTRKPVITAAAKYIPAEYAGTQYSHLCTLIAVEGDSAATMVKAGLGSNNRSKFNIKDIKTIADAPACNAFYGMISLQGVIPNIYSKFIEVKGVKVRNYEIDNNERLNNIRFAIGLNYDKKYDNPADYRGLNYGRVLICTDEDLDGVGKIASLLLTYFYACWPNLLYNNYIYRMKTPLIRAKTSSGVVEFFTNQMFDKWTETPAAKTVKGSAISYYKGLAAHSDGEIVKMFKKGNFGNNVYRFHVKDRKLTDEMFRIYFGNCSNARKDVMSEPIQYLTVEEEEYNIKNRIIPIEDEHFSISTKEYKMDATERQLIHVLDGLTEGRRKIAYTAEDMDKQKGPVVVASFAASAMIKTKYVHGEDPIVGTTVYVSQDFIGARFYPLLLRKGSFGDRHGGKPGQPRYIKVRYNKIIEPLYPAADRDFLKISYVDKEPAEYEHYMPILPMHILETSFAVSEGWSNTLYGRDLDDVINIIKEYLETYPINDGTVTLRTLAEDIYEHRKHTRKTNSEFTVRCIRAKYYGSVYPLRPNTKRYKGEIRNHGNLEVSFGCYEWYEKQNKVIVTELPLNVTTESYIKKLFGELPVDRIHSEEDYSKYSKTATAANAAAAAAAAGAANKVQLDRCINYVQKYVDRSSPSEVYLEFHMYPGAISKIMAPGSFGNDFIDPIEDFFCLYESLRPNINMFSPYGSVLEFGDSYLAAMLYWITFRKDMYERRIKRQYILIKYELAMKKELLRYINEYEKIDLRKCEDAVEAAKCLKSLGYNPYNTAALSNPGSREDPELITAITEESQGATYRYLIKVGTEDLFKSSVKKLTENIKKLEQEQKGNQVELGEVPIGKTRWLSEIQMFKDSLVEMEKQLAKEFEEDSQ